MLKEFRLSPARYFARITGKIPDKDSHAFRIGRAAHKLILEGERAYRAVFSVGGPFNQRTGCSFSPGTKAFQNWLRECGLDPSRVLSPSEAQSILRMRDAVLRHRGARELLAAGWAERVAEAELRGVACQARLDWLTPGGALVDVKTTARMDDFENEARRRGYLHQFAFYRAVAAAAGAGDLRVSAVVVEKRPPYRVCVWSFPEAVLAPYAAENAAALGRLLRCRETREWGDGYEVNVSRVFPASSVPAVWLN